MRLIHNNVWVLEQVVLYALFAYVAYAAFVWILRENEAGGEFYLRLGLLTGIVAFLVSSMATDSTIGSTSVFFVMFGVLAGLNVSAATPAVQVEKPPTPSSKPPSPPSKQSRKKPNKKPKHSAK